MSAFNSIYPQTTLKSGSLMESLLQPLRQQLDSIEIRDAELARALCKLIPSQCPFARDIQLFGRTLFRIPPLCKINPLYEQLMGLRLRSLVYLADVCGEDVTPYCY
jgi:hypothetical protein